LATAPADRPRGIDVSHFQFDVDWKRVKDSGYSFAFVKATEGLGNVDSKFAKNWPAIYKAGIKIRGAYHYGHIESDPAVQAAHFVATVRSAGKIARGDFLILDAEDVCSASRRISPAKTAAWVNTFLDEVVRLSGLPRRRVLLYTGDWWWSPRAGGSNAAAVSGHPLWLSAYVSEARLNAGKLWEPWPTWRFWQYTSSGKVDGVNGNVDKNVFNGTARGLWWLSGRPLRLFGRK